MYLTKLDQVFNISKLQDEVTSILETHPLINNQISLNYREGYKDLCWSDGCGSPFMTSEDRENNPIHNRNANLLPRFIDTDFIHLNPGIENTEIAEIYNYYKTKYKIGRYRIAVLRPKSCYGWHYDLEKRIHVAVFTNPGSFIITDDGKATHLPATGESWMFNANNGYHTAINASYNEKRVHLLLNIY